MNNMLSTRCLRCGIQEPMTTVEALLHDEACRKFKGDRTGRCPVHLIPDCSPLLNGCSRLTEPTA